MIQDRSINNSGNMEGVINVGDHVEIIYKKENPLNVCQEIEDILKELEKRYSGAPKNEKEMVLKMELQQKVKSDPIFRQRFISAAKSGGIELIKVLTDNPFVSVPMETAKGWIEAE